MKINILKSSDIKGLYHILNAKDILAMHLGYFWMNGKVTCATNISIATQPDYVILTVDDEKYCYLCHVEDAKAEYEIIDEARMKEFMKYLPKEYHDNRDNTLLLLDSIQKLPIEFLDGVLFLQKNNCQTSKESDS